jgi:hypothetical protein
LLANQVTVLNSGAYLLGYGINLASGAVPGDSIHITVNGVATNGTSRQISSVSQTSSTTILNLTAGSVVGIGAVVAAPRVVSGEGAASAYLSLTQIA